jgi:hypothetical protein
VQKWTSPVQDSSRQQICRNEETKKDQKLDPLGKDNFLISSFTSDLFLKHVSLDQNWTVNRLNPVLLRVDFSPPKHLLQLRCSNVETHQRHTNKD